MTKIAKTLEELLMNEGSSTEDWGHGSALTGTAVIDSSKIADGMVTMDKIRTIAVSPNDAFGSDDLYMLPGGGSIYHRTLLGKEYDRFSGFKAQIKVDLEGEALENWTTMVQKLELPEEANTPAPVYTVDYCPFETVEEFNVYALRLAAWDVKITKQKFNVRTSIQFPYQGQLLKFIGMEEYQLLWVETLQGEDNEPKFRYYFKASEASRVPKLYALTASEVSTLFGNEPLVYFGETIAKVRSWEEQRQLLDHIQSQILDNKYNHLGFGSW